MTSEQFNKKYNLGSLQNKEDLFVRASQNTNKLINIGGKPKKMLREIAKRFFFNWVTVLCTILFFAVLLTSIIVSVTAKYPSNDSIANYTELYIPSTNGGTIKISATPYVIDLPPFYKDFIPVQSFPGGNSYAAVIENLKSGSNGSYQRYLFENFVQDGVLFKIAENSRYDNGEYVQGKVLLVNFKKFIELENLSIAINKYIELNNYTGNDWAKVISEIRTANSWNSDLQVYSIFGTTQAGIDVWTSSWISTWNAIWLAIVIATLQTIIGVFVGSYLGFHVGSKADTIIMRLIDIFSAPPTLIWLLLFASLWGTSNLTLIVALVFTGWTGAVDGTRMYIITVKDSEFITASKSVGASKLRLIYMHALPAIIGKIATSYVRRIPGIILSISSLAFLGFFTAKEPNLGALINEAVGQAKDNFWILLLPSLILLSISVSLHFMALGIHDALDPKVIRGKN